MQFFFFEINDEYIKLTSRLIKNLPVPLGTLVRKRVRLDRAEMQLVASPTATEEDSSFPSPVTAKPLDPSRPRQYGTRCSPQRTKPNQPAAATNAAMGL
jgi:hypothetical protein